MTAFSTYKEGTNARCPQSMQGLTDMQAEVAGRLIEPFDRLLEKNVKVFPLHTTIGDGKCSCGSNPCRNVGKHPRINSFDKKASLPELGSGLMKLWSTVDHHWDSANIGIPCGPNQLLILDEDALDEVQRFCADHGVELPETFKVRTARGYHYYFRQPEGLQLTNSEGPLKDYGVNVRGYGGYVVGPGSVHASGVVYEPVSWDAPIAELPQSLIEILPQRIEHLRVSRADVKVPADGTIDKYGEEALASEIKRFEAEKNGGRNNALNKAAFRLGQIAGEGHLGLDIIRRELFNAAERSGYVRDDGIAQAQDTIRSGIDKGLVSPRPKKNVDTETTSEEAAASWKPIDLTPYLDGTYTRPEPGVGVRRTDGVAFLYPGKHHAIVGETESGKSWFCLACVLTEMRAGNKVVYIHFEESDPSGTVDRLLAMGATREQLMSLFVFVGPYLPSDEEYIGELLEHKPSLVILDGVNEGMAMHGMKIMEPDGITQYRNQLVKPWLKIGAAVLDADHVTKASDGRGRDAFGSVHKGNALDGCRISLENKEPFGRGQEGLSKVYITKDRPGFLRKYAEKTKMAGKDYIADLVVDARGIGLHFELRPFAAKEEEMEGETRNVQLEADILDLIAREPEQMFSTVQKVADALAGAKRGVQKKTLLVSLADLVTDKRLEIVHGARNAKGYRLLGAPPAVIESFSPASP